MRVLKAHQGRKLALWLHRYVGLFIAVFLLLAGVTGSIITYYHELDAALNPRLYQNRSSEERGEAQDILALGQGLTEQIEGSRLSYVFLGTPVDQAAVLFVEYDEAVVNAEELDDEFFVDRYSGAILGSRKWGDLSQGWVNFVPFCYSLHFTLALGTWGRIGMGVIALLWTLDCFVGAYLTFPPARPNRKGALSKPSIGIRMRSGGQWIRAWGRAWLLKSSNLFALVFTWHRASGLAIWGFLFIFAWSAVALNLYQIYTPVMRTLFETRDVYSTLPTLSEPRLTPKVSYQAVHRLAQQRMAELAEYQGFEVFEEASIHYKPRSGLYIYKVRSSRDVSLTHPNTTLWLDGDTGREVVFSAPTGEATGNTINTWLTALHFGEVNFGRGLSVLTPVYRAFVLVLGLIVAALSVTGVWLWWTRRFQSRSRRRKDAKAQLKRSLSF